MLYMCSCRAALACSVFGGSPAANAYDGSIATFFSSNTETNPYISFQLDGFSSYSDISGLQIWARQDSFVTAQSQFQGYSVAVSGSPTPGSGTLCASGLSVNSSITSFNVSCPLITGITWVTVYKTGASSVLSLGEIKVVRCKRSMSAGCSAMHGIALGG